MITYSQAFEDRQYLWKEYAAAHDMTGGYVDEEDLEELLANPTKKQAEKCLENQIRYWFEAGPDPFDCSMSVTEIIGSDPKVAEMIERYSPSYINGETP